MVTKGDKVPKVKHINLNYSTASEWYTCRRKFAWSKMLALVPVGPEDEASEDVTGAAWFKGTLIHRGLEAYEQGLPWEEEMSKLVPEMSVMKSLSDERAGSFHHMTQVVKKYIERYKEPEDEFEIIQTEQRYELPITPWLTLNGTLDVIARRRDSGRLYLLDYKTSSAFNMFTLPTLDIAPQFALYLGLASASGLKLEGVVVDCISTALKDLQAYDKDPSKLLTRYETTRSEAQVAEVITSMTQVGHEMKVAIEEGIFPPTFNTGSCKAYNQKCEFFDVCGSETTVRENMLKKLYKKASDTGNFMLELEASN